MRHSNYDLEHFRDPDNAITVHRREHFASICDALYSWLEERSWAADSIWSTMEDRQILHEVTMDVRQLMVENVLGLRIRWDLPSIIERSTGLTWNQLAQLKTLDSHGGRIPNNLIESFTSNSETFWEEWVAQDDESTVGDNECDESCTKGETSGESCTDGNTNGGGLRPIGQQDVPRASGAQPDNVADFLAKREPKLLLYRERMQIIERMRAEAGLPHLFEHRSTADLLSAADKDPIVLLFQEENKSYALILHSWTQVFIQLESAPPELLRLLHSLLGVMITGATRIRRSYEKDDTEDDDEEERGEEGASGRGPGDRKSPKHKQEILRLFKKLWTSVVRPVLDRLLEDTNNVTENESDYFVYKHNDKNAPNGHDSPKWAKVVPDKRKRIWWCCLDDFSFLPIHAAGIYDDTEEVICVSDFFISSYIPSISALIDARLAAAKVGRQHKLLAVADCRGGELLTVRKELQEILDTVPEQNREVIEITDSGDEAVGVVEKLQEASIIHFACHGVQDPSNPARSGFEIGTTSEERLTIQQLISQCRHPPNAYIAILSACQTAANDLDQPEELMNLSTAMMFLGFKSILGTKWAMNDDDGPVLAKMVYGALRDCQKTESEGSSSQAPSLDATISMDDDVPMLPDQTLAIEGGGTKLKRKWDDDSDEDDQDGGENRESKKLKTGTSMEVDDAEDGMSDDTFQRGMDIDLSRFSLARVADAIMRELRDKPNSDPRSWAAFVHVGI